MSYRRPLILACLAAALAVVALLPPASAAGARSVAVTIRGGAFTPARTSVRAGDVVVWTNGDDRDHTVSAADGSFNSGPIRPGGSFTWRATAPGDHPYGCSLHPRMRGSVSVQ